ncbi:mitochondrial assembly of ribosomal large subunit protein 1-like [Zophobas morio]|uniref:mitochondrial assembly of ribosomal large subunit protein 1-like n=1 Tax=Zophobas morio TaxID=2755281 RepID=UPI0030833BF6
METSLNLFKRLCPLLLECKCKALVAINVSGRHERANYFIIVTTLSARHSRKVIEEIKKLWQELSSDKNSFVVDENDLNWCILQIEGVQVHLLDAPTRQRLELEKLWVLGKYDDQLCDMMTNHVKLMPRGKRRMRIKYIFNESEQ